MQSEQNTKCKPNGSIPPPVPPKPKNLMSSERDKNSSVISGDVKNTVKDSSSDDKKIINGDADSNHIQVVPAYQVKLERVLGLTVSSNSALDCDPTNGLVAYPAGCTVVLLNPKRNRQSHVQNASRKTITCVTFSSCGRYLATGECGHVPSVRVWDLADKSQVAEFAGHKFGVSCVAFSPAQKYVVSVGSQHDMIVNVWDWRAGAKIASNKFSSKVKAVSFAENGSYFVTVGNRHVKFWYLDVDRGHKFKEPVPLTGRSAILGELRNNYFCDVACGRGEMGDSTFAITKSGFLCEFNNRRLLDKWVELRTASANCIVAGEELIFVGCAEGIIRCFSPFDLQFITTLPRTHYLGVDISKGLNISHMASHPNQAKYPDVIAVSLDEVNRKVTAVYNDHSLYIWDVRDIKRVGKSHSYLYHSACIWGVEVYPVSKASKRTCHLPSGSFLTCSSDDTIRIWNIDSNMPLTTQYKRNIYSQELLKILYVDSDLSYLKDTDVTPQNNNSDKTDGTYDSRNGVRCIKINPEGNHLASGDRAGNIRIHDLSFNEEICKIEAHDAEVLCLEYSKPSTGYRLLSSASRDRLIHVFDVSQEYNFVQTIDDHSSAITSVRFYQSQGSLQMVSCGADRSIIFRSASQHPQSDVFFSRGHNVACKTTLYDMEVDHGQRHILTACQDRNIRVYNVNSGKQSKTLKGSLADDGTLIKVVLDQSGIYAATSCTDKSICIYDYYSGDCMASMYGHSEIVTGLRFSADGKHLITVSGDGCIFVWSLPHDMTQIILARLAQQAERAEKSMKDGRKSSGGGIPLDNSVLSDNGCLSPVSENAYRQYTPEMEEPPDYKFNMGQLPLWAKKQINDLKPKSNGTSPNNMSGNLDMPKGRWAQRLPNNPVTFKSHYDTDSTVPYPATDKRLDSESSKESSLEDSHQKQFGGPIAPPRKFSNKQGILTNASNDNLSPSPDGGHEMSPGEEAYRSPPVSKGSKKFGYPLTDDSDVSSLRVDDVTTDHDGDIEDYCEHDDESVVGHSGHTMYYPASQESVGDFTVNAMDVEELRRSQRRHRKYRPERPTDIPLASISASQESDDDEDVSTPSAETSDRTLMSMLSVSTENVERLGRRESFLKNNFESLEGDAARDTKEMKNKNSISYKFNSRNREVTNSNKRQELLKRIEETKSKLKSIGYKSSLRSSKSISDLCNIPEKDSPYMGHHHQDGGSGDSGFSSATGGTGAMRRACSLSDLTNPGSKKLLPTISVSGKKTQRSPKPRAIQGDLSRSNSIGVLNQPLEEDTRPSHIMRHTISSLNKMTPRALKRKSSLSQAASTGDIRHLHEDSSSEDMSPSEHKVSSRLRMNNTDRRAFPARAVSERDLSRSNALAGSGSRAPYGRFYSPETGPVHRKTRASISDISRPSSAASTVDFSPEEYGGRGYFTRLDIDSAPLNVTLVESVCEWAVEGCERLNHLWWRVCNEGADESSCSSPADIEDRRRALRALLLGASARATHALAPLTSPSGGLTHHSRASSQADTKDPRVVAMMQQYTDVLVSMVQQKMAQQPHSHNQPPGPS